MLRGAGRVVLVETGPPSYCPILIDRLAQLGVTPADVTDVLITHAHWDHLGNVSMFGNARRWIGRTEYEDARAQAPATPFISQPLLRAVGEPENLLHLIEEGEVFEGVRAHWVPGHTPGHLAFEVDSNEGTRLFVGDAAKNVHELESLAIDSALDRIRGLQSIATIRDIASRTGALVVPGHDVPCSLRDGEWFRQSEQRAALEFFHRKDGPPARIVLSDTEPGTASVTAEA